MNFMRYTFKGRFGYYAAIACVIAVAVMLVMYVTGNTRGAWIVFFVLTTLLKIGITGSYFRWKAYNKHRDQKLLHWGDKTRLN